MRRFLLFIASFAVLFAACTKDETETGVKTSNMELNVNSLGFFSSGGTKTFILTADGDWKIEGGTDWCNVYPTSGGSGTHTISVTVDSKELTEDRNTVLTIGDKNFTVTQKRTGAMTLTPAKFEVGPEGGTIVIEVDHNMDFNVIIPEQHTWLTRVESKSQKSNVYIEVGASREYEKRDGSLVIETEDGNISETIYIYQAQNDYLVLGKNHQTLNNEAQVYSVELRTNINYDVEIEDEPEWISVSETKAIRTDVVRFDVKALSEEDGNREAIITFIDKNSGKSDKLVLCQLADGTLIVSKSVFEFDAKGGAVYAILLDTDYTTEVIKGMSWLTPVTEEEAAVLAKSESSQLATQKLWFQAFPNYSKEDRYGEIMITDEYNGVTDVIKVYQDAKDFSTNDERTSRLMVASINKSTGNTYHRYDNGKILISWRMLLNDTQETAFDLYRMVGGETVKLNSSPIVNTTNFQDTDFPTADITYILKYADDDVELDRYTITQERVSGGLCYTRFDLKETASDPNLGGGSIKYVANDATVGHLLGRDDYQMVIRRNASATGQDGDDDEDGGTSDTDIYSPVILEAYELDGTFLWSVILGPNIVSYNGVCFPTIDMNGDGVDEIIVKTSEGTIFGDGKKIGDVNKGGIIDYRPQIPAGQTFPRGQVDFLSILDGRTGAEIARAPYIPLGDSSTAWGDNYWKRANSIRITAGLLPTPRGPKMCAMACRGIYAKSVVEAWEYDPKGDVIDDNTTLANMEKLWKFDSDDYPKTYDGQGCHSVSVGDVDGDGCDELVYGGMTIDHDGTGLNTSGLGHGDQLHLGDFDPRNAGLEIYQCYETGLTQSSLRDARTNRNLVRFMGSSNGDMGRAIIGDFHPDFYGCEMFQYEASGPKKLYDIDGNYTGYDVNTAPNMAIWFTGSLNRQTYNGNTIDHAFTYNSVNGNSNGTRVLTLNSVHFDVTTINSTKSNPCWYGDIMGDWREEIIMPSQDLQSILIFSSWFYTEYKIPYLMSDHVYKMSAMNQHVGYNQPNHVGYYLGSDMFDNK